MNPSSFDRECTNQCKSTIHGDVITDAISKRSISDQDLCSFLNFVCSRCESVIDSSGRTALHVAASCGRLNLVRWLILNRHADIHAKDRESSYTALHRSIFYGKIDVAVELVKLGANTSDLDLDYLTSLEHAMKDGLKPEAGISGGELYSWGSNNNNLLGPQQTKQSPDLLDSFHREYPGEYAKQICIAQFHSTIVTVSGKALTCGHGQGGRLGLGDEKTVVTPKVVNFVGHQKGEVVTCNQASISRDHSIFLCSDGNIYTCGLNTYQVLGQVPPPERSLVPKPIKHLSKEILGVCSSQYHSVAWGPDGLYTWGLNAGQLGVKTNEQKSKFIAAPKLITIAQDVSINHVASSNGAIAVCTTNGDIYVFHEYLCRKIASRQLNFIQVSIVGGTLDSSLLDKELAREINCELKVAVLTSDGNVLLWQGSDQQLCRCIYSINRAIVMKQIEMNLNELLMVSRDGEAFKGFIKPRKKRVTNQNKITNSVEKNQKTQKSAFHKFLEKEDCVVLSLQKITKIHRALSMISDLKGKDFAIIQAPPYKNFTFGDIERSEMKENFETLLLESDDCDTVHDVLFKINDKNIPAHKYVVANASPYLEKLMEKQDKVILNSINSEIFRQMLKFMYTGECELTKCGELKNETLKKLCYVKDSDRKDKEDVDDVIEVNEVDKDISAFEYYKNNQQQNKQKHTENKTKQSRNPVRLLHEMAKKYECVTLQKCLSNLEMSNYVIFSKNHAAHRSRMNINFERLNFASFYDVTIKCRDNKTLSAHKCVLAARMEYFNNMFMRWHENSTAEVSLPFPKNTVEALLEYLYTDSLSKLNALEVDHLFNVVILADQLFVQRLKEQCELLLSDLLTMKNVIQVLSFADVYCANKLKYCCMMFIIANITPLLELKAFNDLDDDLLKELSDFYFDQKKEIHCRVITPYSTAESDEVIASIASTYPVSMSEEVDITPNKPVHKKRNRPHRTSEKSNSISEKDASYDSIIQFPDEPDIIAEVDNKITELPNRLKSITLASKIVKEELVQENFTKLNKSSLSVSFDDSVQFPELGSSPVFSLTKASPQKTDTRTKPVKMSQKQRKRLSSESKAVDSPPIQVTPKNPWKILPEASSPVSTADPKHFGDIISDEKKQKENLLKLTNRPLLFTQMEDKAIDELHKFYNVENAFDELITIERVNIGAVACPVWVPKQK
uniref:Inhibitor of Bruton tyrosine kinase n=1 Tax=Diabrotica virgifera virgifera TaxID=50390 RepID=A0A6P7F2T9_DIAVI